MTQIYWHVRITLDSSTVEQAKQLAKSERRSVSNYVASLIEDAQRKEARQQNEQS